MIWWFISLLLLFIAPQAESNSILQFACIISAGLFAIASSICFKTKNKEEK